MSACLWVYLISLGKGRETWMAHFFFLFFFFLKLLWASLVISKGIWLWTTDAAFLNKFDKCSLATETKAWVWKGRTLSPPDPHSPWWRKKGKGAPDLDFDGVRIPQEIDSSSSLLDFSLVSWSQRCLTPAGFASSYFRYVEKIHHVLGTVGLDPVPLSGPCGIGNGTWAPACKACALVLWGSPGLINVSGP